MDPASLAPSQAGMMLEGEITTNVIVAHHKAGRVIGKGGEVIGAIRETSRANLHVSEHTGLPERIVTVQGPFPAVHAAFTLVVRHVIDEGQPADHHTVKLAVTNDDAGGLIGKAGCVINELRQQLGGAQNCLQVDPADPSKPDVRLVTLNGSFEMIRRGHELVCQKILERHKRKMAMGDNNGARTAMPGMMQPGGGLAPGVTPTQVQVPNDRIGNVIGRAGTRINEIRQLSGAKIHIDQVVPNNPNRLVTITGTPEQTQWAQYMISVAMAGGEPVMAMGHGAGGVQTAYHQPQPGYGSSAGGSGSGAAVADNGPKAAPVQMQVPNDSMGNVIGRGGANINHIRQLSGASIHIGDIQMNSPYRLVTLSGTYQQTQMAQYLVNMAMGGGDVKSWSAGDVLYVLAGQQGQTSADGQQPASSAAMGQHSFQQGDMNQAAHYQGGYSSQPQSQYDQSMYQNYYNRQA